MSQALNLLLPQNPGHHHHSTDEAIANNSTNIISLQCVLSWEKKQVPIKCNESDKIKSHTNTIRRSFQVPFEVSYIP
jgi:hypothetical protein